MTGAFYGVAGAYDSVFYFAGVAVFVSGIMFFLLPRLLEKESWRISKNLKLAWKVGKTAEKRTNLNLMSSYEKSLGQMMFSLHSDVVLPLGILPVNLRRNSVAVITKL